MTTAMSIINTYSGYSSDYQLLKEEMELDAYNNLSIINGKRYPYTIIVEPVQSKRSHNHMFRAKVLIYDNELERDLFVLRNQKGFLTLNNN